MEIMGKNEVHAVAKVSLNNPGWPASAAMLEISKIFKILLKRGQGVRDSKLKKKRKTYDIVG